MLDRRQLLGALSVPAVACTSPARLHDPRAALARAREASDEEAYWFEVGRAFTVDRSLVNLNNAGVCPAPDFVQEAMRGHLEFSHKAPAYTMWRILEPGKEGVRQEIAHHAGVDAEEIALTRNASEGLQICQLGFDLQPGDQVLTTTQDYPRMITTFRQRERREGIELVQFPIPAPCEDPEEIVRRFEANVTDRTKLILVSHVVFLNGQVLPVREVCALGRRLGIPVIVDGAHSFGQLDFRLPDLECDYYATSLHKWLFAPHGTGMLYVEKSRIEGLWPLMAAPEGQSADIRKFEEIGTHPAANTLAISEALAFHQGIGQERKLDRLVHLRDYWARRLLEHERVHLYTSLEPGFAGGTATVDVQGVDATALSTWLWSKHRILVVAIHHADMQGIRVSPSVYTSHEELDRFCDAMEYVIRNGLPEKV